MLTLRSLECLMIDTQNINLSKLPFIPIAQAEKLPRIPAIYFCLVFPGDPIYIGETSNLWDRWKHHDRKVQCMECWVHSIAWIDNVPLDPHRRKQVEKQFIRHYRPVLNSQLKSGLKGCALEEYELLVKSKIANLKLFEYDTGVTVDA